jgi:hypothetical protein
MLQSVENFNVQANILGNYVRDESFVHKYIIPSSIPLEISKTSLGTQIMLPSQFVDLFRANLMLIELLYNYHGV